VFGGNPFKPKTFVVFIQIAMERKRNTLEKKRFYTKNGIHDHNFENIIFKNVSSFCGAKWYQTPNLRGVFTFFCLKGLFQRAKALV